MNNKIPYTHIKPYRVVGDDFRGGLTQKEAYTSDQYIRLTEKLIDAIKDQGYTSIIAIARGGLSILAMIERYGKGKLPNNIKFGTLHAASYTGVGEQGSVMIADGISFFGGGDPGVKPLFLDDMLDKAKSKQAIDLWAKEKGISEDPRWAVLLQKAHSPEDAHHVAQHMGSDWVVQPHENYASPIPGENVLRILTTPKHIIDDDFDNLQRLAELIGMKIHLSGTSPSAIIGRGDIRTAHVASMISRILCLPSGTQFDGGSLSFVRPEAGKKNELGDYPIEITLPSGLSDSGVSLILRVGGELERIFHPYQI